MKISDNGINLIREFEGLRLTAYQDAVGVWTIGYGTTNADQGITGVEITKGLTITKAVAENWLKLTLDKKYGVNVMKYDATYHWNQNQYDALCSFAYNIGSIGTLTGNGTRTIEQISEKILLYNKAGGKELTGLTRRRKAEKKLFDTPMKKKDEGVKKELYKAKVTAKSGLNIRKGPGKTNAVIYAVPLGTVVSVLQESAGWGKVAVTVKNKQITGWVCLDYVKRL